MSLRVSNGMIGLKDGINKARQLVFDMFCRIFDIVSVNRDFVAALIDFFITPNNESIHCQISRLRHPAIFIAVEFVIDKFLYFVSVASEAYFIEYFV